MSDDREQERREKALRARHDHSAYVMGEANWARANSQSEAAEYWLRGFLEADRSRDAEITAKDEEIERLNEVALLTDRQRAAEMIERAKMEAEIERLGNERSAWIEQVGDLSRQLIERDATIAKLLQAVGLASTFAGSVRVDANDPLAMMQEVEKEVAKLRAKVEAAERMAAWVGDALMFGMTDKTKPERLLRAFREAGGKP